MSDPALPAREVFRHFPGWAVVLFYVVTTAAMADTTRPPAKATET